MLRAAQSRLPLQGMMQVKHCNHPNDQELSMNLNLSLTPLISLLAGILILVVPRLLNFIVAIYLILIGLVGLFGAGSMRI